ncbi:GerMN domain-containing protein [Nocardioides perillae]|uniref:GerMN domain-containing protein n=1 Tax=Nocardioides perillae TaxID=1119534 RepID=A0A7Y9RV73_9ACTN|nr:hypothetical protein [Nocardioides perillae]
MSRGARRTPVVAVLLALLLAVSGCVGLPESGPVVETGERARDGVAPGYSYVPQPPQAGASPGEVVRGFLDAMTATPLQTAVARQFLAVDAQATWEPERGTVTYDEVSDPSGTGTVSVRLSGGGRLDARGAWQGPLSAEASTLDFPMVQEEGEWRIGRAPDALVVPESWFGQRFRSVDLYFLDPTARVLVPEPVFAPRGEQLATTLVQGLVAGPGPALRGVARTFFPAGSAVELSVVVADGLAEVSLQGDPRALDGQAAELVLAQLAWTLRQDPAVRSLRLTVGGEPVTVAGGPSATDVDSAAAYDPTVVTSSSQLFGLRDGAVVVASPGVEEQVSGPLGTGDYQLRDLAVDLGATRVAGVAADGSAVWVAPLDGVAGAGGRGGAGVVTWPGADHLRPGWDHAGRLWLLDAGRGGAELSVVVGGRRRVVEAPGVTGQRVRQLLVSRDGSRLVTVLAGGGGRVQVSRVRYDERGRVLGVGRPVRLGRGAGDPLVVRDVGWASPTDLLVVHAVTGDLTELRSLRVDGSPASLAPEGSADLLRERVRQVVSSPVADEPLLVSTPAGLLDPRLPAGEVLVPPDVTDVTYVG